MTRRTTTPERTTRRPTTQCSLACSRERAGDGATSTSVSSKPLIRLQSAQEGVKAGREALAAVTVPGVDAVRGQGGEAAGGQGAEERVQLFPGGGVAQPLLGGRRRV